MQCTHDILDTSDSLSSYLKILWEEEKREEIYQNKSRDTTETTNKTTTTAATAAAAVAVAAKTTQNNRTAPNMSEHDFKLNVDNLIDRLLEGKMWNNCFDLRIISSVFSNFQIFVAWRRFFIEWRYFANFFYRTLFGWLGQ